MSLRKLIIDNIKGIVNFFLLKHLDGTLEYNTDDNIQCMIKGPSSYTLLKDL